MHGFRKAAVMSALTALAIAAPASATTTCVPTFAACPGGVGDAQTADIQAAVVSMRTDGVPDTIHIAGAHTYAHPTGTLTPSGTDRLEVVGKGPASVIATASAANIFVVDLNMNAGPAPITLRDLQIEVQSTPAANTQAAIQMTGNDLLDRVEVEIKNDGSNAITATGGGTLRRSRIFASGAGAFVQRAAVANGPGTLLVEDSRIENAANGLVVDDANEVLDVRRSQVIRPSQIGIHSAGGIAKVENSVVTLSQDGAVPLLAAADSAAQATLTADHVTLVSENANASAVSSRAVMGQSGSATLTLANSVTSGFPSAYHRAAPTGPASGNANLTIRHSLVPNAGTQSGDGTLDTATGNLAQVPIFENAAGGDFRLAPGSPGIDAGEPAAGGPAADFDGNPRVQDGNGDCVDRRDMGAFERAGICQPAPPAPPQEAGAGAAPGPVTGPVGPFGAEAAQQARIGFGRSLRLSVGKVRRGRIAVTNRNDFAVTGSLRVSYSSKKGARRSARTRRVRFSVKAGARTRVRVRLPRRVKKYRVALTARDPLGVTRRLNKRF